MKNSYITYGLLIVIIVILLIEKCSQKPEKIPENSVFTSQNTVFVPETLHRGFVYIPDTTDFPYYVFPKQVITYKNEPPEGKVICKEDSLLIVIDSLRQFTIPSSFITNNITAPKLLYGFFGENRLHLDFFNPQGNAVSLNYRVNFKDFEYEFKNNELRAELRKKQPFWKRFSYDLYGYGGYEFINTKPLASLEFNLNYSSFRLSTSLSSTIWLQPDVYGFVRLGYKIK